MALKGLTAEGWYSPGGYLEGSRLQEDVPRGFNPDPHKANSRCHQGMFGWSSHYLRKMTIKSSRSLVSRLIGSDYQKYSISTTTISVSSYKLSKIDQAPKAIQRYCLTEWVPTGTVTDLHESLAFRDCRRAAGKCWDPGGARWSDGVQWT